MTGSARGPLRSSARLSNGGGGGSAATAAAASQARAAARTAEAAAAAARRRARAAERAREVEDSPQELRDKCKRLAEALRNAKHLVVYTGAGISTAADIPDYRGPRGVWTRLRRGETVGRVEVSLARPTLTHMALTALWARGTLKFVVSQNCDGLHVRAGLPRRALAELHGDMFAERCSRCRRVYLRAFDTTERTARHTHGTARLCHRCGTELCDTIVHFGERGRSRWPLNWAGALRHAARADVVLCLGSSLKVLRRYPRLWRMQHSPAARPALYIVNLQWTPKDSVAKLKINARCDAVMAQVARRLSLPVGRYSPRADPLLAHAVPLAPQELHTTRRPLLPPPPASPSPSSSLSSSDSDDEVPLTRLAERMRRPPPQPPPDPPVSAPPRPLPQLLRSPLSHVFQHETPSHEPLSRGLEQAPSVAPRLPRTPLPALRPLSRLPPPPDLLHAFQVNMCTGDATILLRAQHAPSVQGGPPAPPRRAPSDLRLFRMARRPPSAPLRNGHAPLALRPPTEHLHSNGHIKLEDIKREGDIKSELEQSPPRAEPMDVDVKAKRESDLETNARLFKLKRELESEEREASALAAAIIARAVLLCRASGSLYPGLHTILAPRAPTAAPAAPPAPRAAPRADCAWCARHYSAPRCLWYGPPPVDVTAGRTWRRVRGRRYLCACCGEGGGARAAGGGDEDGGGWYGKGYRKGRRRRR